MSGLPSRQHLVTTYRTLLRSGFQAVQYSRPAKYCIRDKIRQAFEHAPPSAFNQFRIDNTVFFLNSAASNLGREHQIVRNLCLIHFWHIDSPLRRRVMPKEKEANFISSAYMEYNSVIEMLNESMDLELR